MVTMWTPMPSWSWPSCLGSKLWSSILLLLIIAIARVVDGYSTHSFTVKGNNCGTYISFDTKIMNIYWRGAALEDDCSLYFGLQNKPNNSMCMRAEVWDITDEHFTLTVESAVTSGRKKFGFLETKENVTFCAEMYDSLILRFFTYFKSRSNIHLQIIQTSNLPDHNHSVSMRTNVYKVVGGIGVVVMVIILVSVVQKRRLRARQFRSGYIISRRDDPDEAMVALYSPASSNNPCTVTSTSNRTAYTGPAEHSFPTSDQSQLMKPPEYSENPANANSLPQYPDIAPPRYEDVAGGRSGNTIS